MPWHYPPNNEEERHDNLWMLYYGLEHFLGFSPNKMAVAAIASCFTYESGFNPAIWQYGYSHFTISTDTCGYGLAQWTPWWKYMNWVNEVKGYNGRASLNSSNWTTAQWETHEEEYADGDMQCRRMSYELENNIQWAVNRYLTGGGCTFEEFLRGSPKVTNTTLACQYFLYSYEIPYQNPASTGQWGWHRQKVHNQWTDEYLRVLGETPPPVPPYPSYPRRGLKIWQMIDYNI